MAIPQRRIPEKRTYRGEGSAKALINWLNLTTDHDAKLRICEVVSLYAKLIVQKSRMKGSICKKNGRYFEKPNADTIKRDEIEDALEKALNYYRMTPSIFLAGPDNGAVEWDLTVLWSALPGSKLDRNQSRNSKRQLASLSKEDFNLPGAQMGESGAIRKTLDLIESHLIWKVAQCRCCKYFFRKFKHQHFCSHKCRIANFRDSDDARTKRNEYARKLYRLHKERPNLKLQGPETHESGRGGKTDGRSGTSAVK